MQEKPCDEGLCGLDTTNPHNNVWLSIHQIGKVFEGNIYRLESHQ